MFMGYVGFYQEKSPTINPGTFLGGAAGYRTPVRKLTSYPSTSVFGLKIFPNSFISNQQIRISL